MWLKYTLSTHSRHKNSKATWAYHMGEAFQAVTAPCYVLGTGQVWALKSHKYCPYIPHRHLGTDMPGQDSQAGHTGTRRDMQHCGME